MLLFWVIHLSCGTNEKIKWQFKVHLKEKSFLVKKPKVFCCETL